MSSSKKKPHFKEDQSSPYFRSSTKKSSSNKKKRTLQGDPDWCWLYEEQMHNGEVVQKPVYNLTKRTKKTVQRFGQQLRTIDMCKKKARYHHKMMNQELENMHYAGQYIGNHMWD